MCPDLRHAREIQINGQKDDHVFPAESSIASREPFFSREGSEREKGCFRAYWYLSEGLSPLPSRELEGVTFLSYVAGPLPFGLVGGAE